MSSFSVMEPHAYLHPALATPLLFPVSKNKRDLQLYPRAPLWTQQCWFTSPAMYQYTASIVRFHTELLSTFCQVKGNWWNGEHPGGPLERTSWGGISKARWDSWATSAWHQTLPLETWRGPVLNRIDIEFLWCMQMLIYINSKNSKSLQY